MSVHATLRPRLLAPAFAAWALAAAAGARGEFDLLSPEARPELVADEAGTPLLAAARDADLGAGWSTDEGNRPDAPRRWAVGERSELRFHLLRARPLILRFSAAAYDYPGRKVPLLGLRVNGHATPPVDLSPGLAERRVPLPAAWLCAGENRLEFDHPWGRSPQSLGRGPDLRPVAVNFAALEIAQEPARPPRPAPPLLERTQPPETLLMIALERPAGGRLAIFAEPAGTAPSRLAILARSDDGRETPLFEGNLTAGRTMTLPLPGGPGEPLRLLLRVEGGPLRYRRLAVPSPPAPRPAAHAPRATAKTVVVVLVDTLRADHLHAFGYGRATSPRLDRFLAGAERFTGGWAAASWTKPSVATLLSGLPPERNGGGQPASVLRPGIPWLPEALQQAGWRTAAVVSTPYVSREFGFARGFAAWRDVTPDDPHTISSPDVVAGVKAELAASPPGHPLFLYIHLNDPHSPYSPARELAIFRTALADPDAPSPVAELTRGALANRLDRYDGEVLQADGAFGAILDALKSAGRGDALVLFTADHGEEFGEHGGLEHGDTLFPEVLRIPVAIRWPDGRRAGTTTRGPVTHTDLAATLRAASGLPPDGEGLDLAAPPPADRPFYLSHGDGRRAFLWRRGGWLWIRTEPEARRVGEPAEWLCAVAADPLCARNLALERPARAAQMRAAARDAHARMPAPPMPGEITDEELKKKLRALGYLR